MYEVLTQNQLRTTGIVIYGSCFYNEWLKFLQSYFRPPLLIRRGRFSDEDATRMWAQLPRPPSQPVASTSQPLHPVCTSTLPSLPPGTQPPHPIHVSPPPTPRPSLKTFPPAPRRPFAPSSLHSSTLGEGSNWKEH